MCLHAHHKIGCVLFGWFGRVFFALCFGMGFFVVVLVVLFLKAKCFHRSSCKVHCAGRHSYCHVKKECEVCPWSLLFKKVVRVL